MDESCLHGSWEDGVCQCERGYVTEFTDIKLYPIYCAEKDDIYVLNLRRGYESVDFLHYVTLSVFELVRFKIMLFGGVSLEYYQYFNTANCWSGNWKFLGISVFLVHTTGCMLTQSQHQEGREETGRTCKKSN